MPKGLCLRDSLDRVREYIKNNSTPDPFSGCWIWNLHIDWAGYGWCRYGYRKIKAHRLAAIAWLGLDEFNFKEQACHTCDNPPCVNPDHLFIGNNTINQRDAIRKGRQTTKVAYFQRSKTHCPKGHEYTKENTYLYYYHKSGAHHRRCRECSLSSRRAKYASSK